MLAGSVAMLHFHPFPDDPILSRALAAVLGVVAIVTSAGSLHRWFANDRAIRADGPLARPRLVTVTALTLTTFALVIASLAAVA
ncbi:hypothetical protein GCM10011591_15290 [Nocardia camponoti]|uniref:DUF202 domain-containing protein n=1 Tax=Nocardia camponoti TaxID=1616106 RepID=A0A917QEA7_9NOCA|nr:hypothetical protein GCM10011591_15290 [Nocardia camponoti]